MFFTPSMTPKIYKSTILLFIFCQLLFIATENPAGTIYMRSSGDDLHDGTIDYPVRTFTRAKQICETSSDTEFEILLYGGDTFTEFYPDTVTLYTDDNTTFAFVWDIDKPLTISTYGPLEKTHLYGAGYYVHNGGPGQAILVIRPSSQDVIIENIYFEMWELGTIMLFETEDVILRNIKIDRIGPYYFPEEQIPGVYCAGVIYPKNSTRILIDNIEMTNCHNNYPEIGALHGFYGTRLNHSEIRNCYLANISGSPFKFRRSRANNVYVHDNECYYTGVSTQTPGQVQFGFVRYSGDADSGCPYALVFENNIFHYPYCWIDLENYRTARAVRCTISNESVCGSDACDDSTKILWINNDFRYQWELTEHWNGGDIIVLEAPGDLSAEAVSDRQIDLSWTDHSDIEEGFRIQRNFAESSWFTIARVDSNVTSYSDQFLLSPSTSYTYRIRAYHAATYSDYSNEASVTTLGDPLQINAVTHHGRPKEYALDHNYPNPFNPSTTIKYQLPEACMVRLTIYSIHGQLVETLVDAFQPGGFYNVVWQPENLPSGIYHYRLEAGHFRMVRNLVYLK